jgi:hypothetical protein
VNMDESNKSEIKKVIIGKIKKFDQRLYDRYDTPARKIMYERLGEHVKDNPNIYGEDMLLDIPGCKYKYLELQVCVKWTEERYPYYRPFVYARKKLFSDDTLFLVLNKEMTDGLLFDKNSLYDEPRRVKKYSRSFVYEVPWHRVLRVNMEEFGIETIKLY